MSKKHTEERLEDAIEYQFTENDCYQKGDSDDFDSERALESARVIAFIEKTQPKIWQMLKAIHGDDTEKVVLDDLCKTLETQGMLNVLRYGFKSYGKKLKVAYFAPSTQLNADTLALYEANALTAAGEGTPLKGPSDVGTGQADEEKIRLSELIDILNDRFGTDFTEADQLFFDQIEAEAKVDDSLKQAAKVNSMSDFLQIFKKSFEGLVIDRMEGNEDIFSRLMSDAEFRDLAQDNLGQKLYRMLAQGVMSEEDQIKLLIPNNESKTLEFKETFSLDVRKGTKEKYIEKSALKTLGAFLNSEGGDLLNGVGG